MSLDYFKARTQRFEAISKNLIKRGFELLKEGYTVYVYSDSPLIDTLYIFDKDRMCVLGFREVEYGWICNPYGYSSPKYGLSTDDQYAIPLSINFIRRHFGPIKASIHYKPTKESFIKFHSWMTPIQNRFTENQN